MSLPSVIDSVESRAPHARLVDDEEIAGVQECRELAERSILDARRPAGRYSRRDASRSASGSCAIRSAGSG